MLSLSGLFIIGFVAYCNSQIPSFGGCPEYQPMGDFNKNKFLGIWYETERLFTVTELASKCVAAHYEKRSDGKIWIDNFMTNRFTGIQRKISGTMKLIGLGGEAKYTVKYSSLPIGYETTLEVLDTDYDNFAIVYSCSQLGPVGHTQSVWLMTRDRFPAGPVLQRAYGVLDKYRISRTFFLKSDQNDCEILGSPIEAYDPTTELNNSTKQNATVDADIVDEKLSTTIKLIKNSAKQTTVP